MTIATPAQGNQHADWVNFGLVIGAGVYQGALGNPNLRKEEPRESVDIAEQIAWHIQPRTFQTRLLRFHEANHQTIKDYLVALKTTVEQIRVDGKRASLFLFIGGRCDDSGHIRLYQQGEVLHDEFLKPHLDALDIPILAILHTQGRPDLYLLNGSARPARYGAIYCRDELIHTNLIQIRTILVAQSPITARVFCDHMSRQSDLLVVPPHRDVDFRILS
ncbi:MAG: hypothetical protein WCF99_03070 [Chloroflexales bacterium]